MWRVTNRAVTVQPLLTIWRHLKWPARYKNTLYQFRMLCYKMKLPISSEIKALLKIDNPVRSDPEMLCLYPSNIRGKIASTAICGNMMYYVTRWPNIVPRRKLVWNKPFFAICIQESWPACQNSLGLWVISHSDVYSLNSLGSCHAYMRKKTTSSMVKAILSHLFCAKLLSYDTIKTHCWYGPSGQSSVEYQSQQIDFHSRRRMCNCRPQIICPFSPQWASKYKAHRKFIRATRADTGQLYKIYQLNS